MTRIHKYLQRHYILLFAIAGSCSFQIVKANPKCDLSKAYNQIFRAELYASDARKSILTFTDSLPPDHCLADWVNPNVTYLNYLLTNYHGFDLLSLLPWADDSIQLQKKFIEILHEDSLFTAVISEFASVYLGNPNPNRPTFKMDKVLNIAVKFFNLKKITPEGYYVGKICVGVSGLTATEKERNPQLEAFCFETIFENAVNPSRFDIHSEFINACKELYKINLGIDESERLMRAQGAIYFLMRQNEMLKTMLLYAYTLRKEFLPFVIVA